MSAAQLQTGTRILEAMGPMINDSRKVDQVIGFIIKLKEDYPTLSKAYLDANTISAEKMFDELTLVINNHYDHVHEG